MDFVNIRNLISQDDIKESIGTKKERTLHQYLKYYFCEEKEYHEQKCLGFIVDILKDNKVIEIQTSSFNTMRKKLNKLLPHYSITIVYPIIQEKIIHSFDEEGVLYSTKKSPKKEHALKIGKELYKISDVLNHNNIHFVCVILKVEEYRIPYINRYKQKKMTRINQIPTELIDIIHLNTSLDYLKLIPFDDEFTSLDFKRISKLSPRDNSSCLLALRKLNVIELVKKDGKKNIYKKCSN